MTSSPETDGTDGTDTHCQDRITRTLELLWEGARRPARGPRPTLTLDRIVETAVGIADAEGLDAVSMRRVAAELGTGAMSLYRYVPGKSELVELMLDRVNRPSPDPDDFGDGTWRAALETMARSMLALHHRHPWVLPAGRTRPLLGPSALDGMEKVLARIRPMGLADTELVSVIIMLEGYVVGAARTQVYHQEDERTSGMTTSDFYEAQSPYISRVMETGRYPVLASLAPDTWTPDFDHFDFGLQRILDGLEALVTRRAQE
ncbi:TetR/AcrR family transcriptional regulator [Streptomyces sp. NPDC004539]|uniref:TetR/AcrR family transcriptional regulator n=1 Tax=Streptomyces sp. NPDC004539 TaxID=3154280 RepID=UPI0033A8F1C6